MFMKIYSLILVLLFCLSSCQEKPTTAADSPQNSDVSKEQANNLVLPSIPVEIMQDLWDNCEFVDYIFYELPFSMSQSEKPSIHANLGYIDKRPVPTGIPTDCKPIAREFFQINGEIVLEAEVYFSKTCQFYVFMDGKSPKYANAMSPNGIKFYNQMINQALEMRKNGINSQQ